MTAVPVSSVLGLDVRALVPTPRAASGALDPRDAVDARPRVLVAALQEPENHLSFSGAFRLMVGALRRAGFEVECPGHAVPWDVQLARLTPLGRFHAPRTRAPEEIADAVTRAAARRARLARHADVVLAPLASEVVPLLPAHLPVVYFTDATPRLLDGGYASADRATPADRARWDEVERRAVARADRVVYASHWAAASGIEDYGASPDAVRVAPFGSPLEVPRARALARRVASPVRLLWVGADWGRKGGVRAIEVLRALRADGLDVQLDMCGGGASLVEREPGVVHHGFLNRRRWLHRRRTARLFEQATVFLLPTRADCSPLVLAEAAAWGLPAVATRVGGIPEIVQEGVTGHLVDVDAPAERYAEAIRHVVSSPTTYSGFAQGARAAWETRLSWEHWAASVGRVIQELALELRAGDGSERTDRGGAARRSAWSW